MREETTRVALREELLRLSYTILAEGDGTAEALGADLATTVLAYLSALQGETFPPPPPMPCLCPMHVATRHAAVGSIE